MIVSGTSLDDDAWQVGLDLTSGDSLVITRYMTAADARLLASALVAAADHYDAETARLAAKAGA